MIEVLRNMWRRKFRTFLTVFGIAIGMYAFTVMGSMALKLNIMISAGRDYATGQISIMPFGTSFMTGSGGSTLPVDVLNRIAQIEGVDKVQGMIELTLEDFDPDNPTASMVGMGSMPMILGSDYSVNFKNRNMDALIIEEGKMISQGDPLDAITIGYTVALNKDWAVGDVVEIRGQNFKVVGIVGQTMSTFDSYVFMHIEPTREMLINASPFLKSLMEQSEKAQNITDVQLSRLPEETRKQILEARAFRAEDLNTSAGVSWKDGQDPEVVSQRIKDAFDKEILVFSPQQLGDVIDQASAIIYSVILGSALLALIVGSFSIINTMVMAVSERTKEIGIKKAIGASNKIIARDFAFEAGVIGFFGGLVGMLLGLITVLIANHYMADRGAEIFLVDPVFMVSVLGFSFVLGIVAGLVPAWRAAKLKIVDAIREL